MSAAGEKGRFGENVCAELLTRRGWEILGRNFRAAGGEVDIIARDGEYIVFCEVKLRSASSAAYSRGAAAVGAEKQRRIISASREYLARGHNAPRTRFDVAELTVETFECGGETLYAAALNLIRGAFGVRGWGEHYGAGRNGGYSDEAF